MGFNSGFKGLIGTVSLVNVPLFQYESARLFFKTFDGLYLEQRHCHLIESILEPASCAIFL